MWVFWGMLVWLVFKWVMVFILVINLGFNFLGRGLSNIWRLLFWWICISIWLFWGLMWILLVFFCNLRMRILLVNLIFGFLDLVFGLELFVFLVMVLIGGGVIGGVFCRVVICCGKFLIIFVIFIIVVLLL